MTNYNFIVRFGIMSLLISLDIFFKFSRNHFRGEVPKEKVLIYCFTLFSLHYLLFGSLLPLL